MADAAAARRNCGNFGDIALLRTRRTRSPLPAKRQRGGDGRQENKGEAEGGGHAPEGSNWGEEKLARSGTIFTSRNIR